MGIIQVSDVYKNFRVGDGEVSVLRGISFDVQAGEFLAIVGPSGNGKSTLLNMITGVDHPSAGEVKVNGKLLNRMNENQLAAWRSEDVGIIFQFFQLLPALNLLQNVMLPMEFARKVPPKQRSSRAMQLLELVGVADQAHKLPGMVSGGQQQRAAIARALANDPPLIVADEPTGNLDARNSAEVFDLFCHLIERGKTLVVVTHNEELAGKAPRMIEIVNGLIAYERNHERALAKSLV